VALANSDDAAADGVDETEIEAEIEPAPETEKPGFRKRLMNRLRRKRAD
jgi:hypothetical protein